MSDGPTANASGADRAGDSDGPGRVVVEVEVDASGRRRFATLRSSSILAVRATPDGVHLVSPSAAPVGGDRVTIDVHVGRRAWLTVRTAAASVARPGPDGLPSQQVVTARVDRGATLAWQPDPLVAACGCHHTSTARVTVASGGQLWWQDELVAGRDGEQPGRCWSELIVDVGGRPALRHQLAIGPAGPPARSPAVVGDATVVATVVAVGRPAWHLSAPGTVQVAEAVATVLPLAVRGAVLVSALAPTHPALLAVLRAAGAEPPPAPTPRRPR